MAEDTIELLRRAKAGDEAAWNAIHQRHREALVRIVHGRIRGGARRRLDTEDLIQSTLLAAFRGLEGFEYRGPGSLQAWLNRLIENRLRHQLRIHMADRRDVRLHADAEPLESHLDFSEMEPGDAILAAERASLLIEAVADLPELDRELLLASQVQRMPMPEICSQFELSASSVRRRIARGLVKLNQRMDDDVQPVPTTFSG